MRSFPQDYSLGQGPLALNLKAQEFYPQGTSDVSDRQHLLHGADEEQDENLAADMGELDDIDYKDDTGNRGGCVN